MHRTTKPTEGGRVRPLDHQWTNPWQWDSRMGRQLICWVQHTFSAMYTWKSVACYECGSRVLAHSSFDFVAYPIQGPLIIQPYRNAMLYTIGASICARWTQRNRCMLRAVAHPPTNLRDATFIVMCCHLQRKAASFFQSQSLYRVFFVQLHSACVIFSVIHTISMRLCRRCAPLLVVPRRIPTSYQTKAWKNIYIKLQYTFSSSE